MTLIDLKHIERNTVKGSVYYNYRDPKTGKRTRLKSPYGSEAFIDEYHAAKASSKPQKPVIRAGQGSFNELAIKYFSSANFTNLALSTQRSYRTSLDHFLKVAGALQVKDFKHEHALAIMSKMKDRPQAANNLIKRLETLLNFAIALGMIDRNPASNVKKNKGGEHHTWSEQEVAQFESFYPIGTKQRALFALLLFTGQRISDCLSLTWGHIENNKFRFKQQKTGKKMAIPILPQLREAIEPLRGDSMMIILTEHGKPFTQNGGRQWISTMIDRAGLPDRCVAHGLRKVMAVRLINMGVDFNHVREALGHSDNQTTQHYAKAANSELMIERAFKVYEEHHKNKNSQTII
jgi:site-specific recombinase XerD